METLWKSIIQGVVQTKNVLTLQDSPAKFRDAGIHRCPAQEKLLERQYAMFFHIPAKHSLCFWRLFSARQLLGQTLQDSAQVTTSLGNVGESSTR